MPSDYDVCEVIFCIWAKHMIGKFFMEITTFLISKFLSQLRDQKSLNLHEKSLETCRLYDLPA